MGTVHSNVSAVINAGTGIELTFTVTEGQYLQLTIASTASGSGHTIKEAGVGLTQRAGLNFGAAFDLTDDAGNDETDVAIDLNELTLFTDLDSAVGAIQVTDVLVGTATAGFTGEIVVGTTPGGELGGTWGSPTVDATHSGSTHGAAVTIHEAAGDPHTGYRLESADHTHASTGLQAGTIDHGVLTGLADPDHTEVAPRVAYRICIAARTYTNLGVADTESNAADRVQCDLTFANEVRLMAFVGTVGATGELKAQYSTDNSAWSDLTTSISLATPSGIKASTFQAVPAGAKQLVTIRIVAFNGNTTEDPIVQAGASVEFQ